MDSCQGAGPFGSESDGRPCLAYVQSWRSPRKPDKTRADVKIPMPRAYMYGSTTSVELVDFDCAERVVVTTPTVTNKTDVIWVMLYL